MSIPENWYPLKDTNGDSVTITWDQVRAINHALMVWREVYRKEKGDYPDLNNVANLWKSCLLGRMLVEGKPPLENAPPVVCAAPAYHLVDKDYCFNCGGLKTEPGRCLSTSIDQKHDIVTELGTHRSHNEPPLGKVVTRVYCAESWHPRPRTVWWD